MMATRMLNKSEPACLVIADMSAGRFLEAPVDSMAVSSS
jgi:hypothetical protein